MTYPGVKFLTKQIQTGPMFFLCALVAGLFLLPFMPAGSGAAKAMGSGSSSSSTSCQKGTRWCVKKSKCVNSRCRRGRIWSSSSCRCVRRSSEALGDDDLYFEAVKLAKSDHYQEALDLLHRIKDANQPRVLNYIGYSTRKLGRVDEGLVYYEKALKINPDYVLAREYLGEGLLVKGNLAGAKQQLAEIKKRCGTDCHAFEDLAKDIAKYEARHQ